MQHNVWKLDYIGWITEDIYPEATLNLNHVKVCPNLGEDVKIFFFPKLGLDYETRVYLNEMVWDQ